MKISEAKGKKIANNYQKYLISCDKLKNHLEVNLVTLQRVLQLNGKTTLLNGTVLTFVLKYGGVRLQITHNPAIALIGHYFTIVQSDKPHIVLSISAKNVKELMYKINYTYKLLKPITND